MGYSYIFLVRSTYCNLNFKFCICVFLTNIQDATIDMMQKQGYASNRLVFIIRVVVQTTRNGAAGEDEDMSYSGVSLLVFKNNYLLYITIKKNGTKNK